MVVAGLVLGIVSIAVGLLSAGVFGWVGIILGVLGIIFSVQGKKKDPNKQGMAVAGLTCSIIGTVISALFFIACSSCIKGLSSMSTTAILASNLCKLL